MAMKNFGSCVAAHRKLIKKCKGLLESHSFDFKQITWYRDAHENSISDVSKAFYSIIELSPISHDDFISDLSAVSLKIESPCMMSPRL